ncbi:hypothetical protein RhiirA5_506786 [Rhizophagus irregularis]|uniref:Uncharacterized protein n=1 Tax=Rhizophagus irregularis TaxID=588596 RepID=A0A2N0NQY7_9GLOM|nr:hypothetical protein RhiirA5_506786 [Rhizophagus irregularis]
MSRNFLEGIRRIISEDIKWKVVYLFFCNLQIISQLLANGSDMKILQEIIYYFDEIEREMINKTGEEVSIPTLWRYFKILWEELILLLKNNKNFPIELINKYLR